MSDNLVFRGELVIGLTAALGTRLDDLDSRIVGVLNQFGFAVSAIRISNLLAGFPEWTADEGAGEGARIEHLQKIANQVRKGNKDGAVLARAAITAIRRARASITGDPNKAADGHAFIVSQFKHPEEVAVMRAVYGPAFILVAGHATRPCRETCLAGRIATSLHRSTDVDAFRGIASNLIEADQNGDPELGQNMQDTFPLADVFIDLNPANGEYVVDRYFELEFGHPFHSPDPAEVGMYQASAAALRSSDFNRQVGAAIVRVHDDPLSHVPDIELIALGMNEVPKRGGGYYWGKESPDGRDQAGGEERASQIKADMLTELIERMGGASWLGPGAGNKPPGELAKDLLPYLKGTKFAAISEFSRPVHAEAAAIIDAARRGVAINGATLFVTTFPCHNCAKHIIAAGIRRVVYLEPYPKSRAGALYVEELSLDGTLSGPTDRRVQFDIYGGIAPRKFRTLFSMAERGVRQGLTRSDWEARRRSLRPVHVPSFLHEAYVRAEAAELGRLAASGFRDPGGSMDSAQDERAASALETP